MIEHTKASIQVGPGLMGCLTIVFVIAKLAGHLDWSWWWVFAPLWGPWAVILGMVTIGGIVAGAVCLAVAVVERFSKPKPITRRRP